MYKSLLALAAICGAASAATRGFNYGAVTRTGAPNVQADFEAMFSTAQQLPNTAGTFSSARLYTMIQAGTPNDPISAIPAAIATNTRLMLGMWASGNNMGNEIAALRRTISTYGQQLAGLVNGISVGSEDLYRISPTGLANDPNGVGADAATLVGYIQQVRAALAGTPLSGIPVGHVDTWDAWRNGANTPVINNVDFLGFNTFPYFQTTDGNSIENGAKLYDNAYAITKSVSQGKPIVVTETGWPVGGSNSAQAIPSPQNAKRYWDEVGCAKLFGIQDVYWYTLVDANTAVASQPQFGIVGTTLSNTPIFDLSCPAPVAPASSSAAAPSTLVPVSTGSVQQPNTSTSVAPPLPPPTTTAAPTTSTVAPPSTTAAPTTTTAAPSTSSVPPPSSSSTSTRSTSTVPTTTSIPTTSSVRTSTISTQAPIGTSTTPPTTIAPPPAPSTLTTINVVTAPAPSASSASQVPAITPTLMGGAASRPSGVNAVAAAMVGAAVLVAGAL